MQRKLHPLEGIVAVCALVFVLSLSIGFAQAQESVRKIALRSSSALVQDAETGEIVFGKNADAVVPIASITKLMTAMVVLDRGLDLEEQIVLDKEDAVAMKGSRSRLRTGLALSRGDLLLLALMSSENRAAAALGRSYPGGMEAFVDAMNAKAEALDMGESRFVEPTGLSPANVSTAGDLAKLVRAAHEYPQIREYSTKDRATMRAITTGRIPRPSPELRQHQRPGALQPLGHRAFQDRLHQRGRPLPGDARSPGGEGPDRGAARFVGQAFARRRREPHQEVAGKRRGLRARRASGLSRETSSRGSRAPQKSLPPKYFYDAAGSRLFARICRLPEYYLTRAELALTRAPPRGDRALRRARLPAGRIRQRRGPQDAPADPRAAPASLRADRHFPSALEGAARRLAREFPGLEIAPVLGDFSRPLRDPAAQSARAWSISRARPSAT